MVQPAALLLVAKPAKHQESRWTRKYYVGRVYLVWQRCDVELRKRCTTCAEAEKYSARVIARFLRMYTPEDSRP